MTDESRKTYDSLPKDTRNIWSKYDESFQFLQAKKQRQVAQLQLISNLQRGDENIASTLLITLFNRIMSNLYDDKMQVKFVPSEELDQKKVNSLNLLAQNDYREMDMKKLDYDWTWDTLFFGRGYMETLRFNKSNKIMEPHVINPLVMGYDYFFDEPQQWRYYWKWISKNRWELQKLIDLGQITGIKSPRDIPSGMDEFLWNYKVIREQARLATPQAGDTYQGDVYQILEFFGYAEHAVPDRGIKAGDKCIYWLDRNFSKILYQEKLDLRDAPDGKGSDWPIVVKEAFREPHASVPFSIADLLEDKHRARSVLLNLAFMAAKDKANPLYEYNPDIIIDVSQFLQRQIGQHVPVKEVGKGVAPLNTQDPLPASLAAFMQILNQEANDPVGTGMALSPGKKGKQSATETAIQQQLNDLAQSLQSKVMQFGTEEFWKDWYQRYKRYSKQGDSKMAAIVGVKGVTFEKIDLVDIQTKYPPGVMIFSAKEAEYKELVLRRDLMQMYGQFQETLGPDGMRNFNKYVFLPKFLNDPTMMDILVPKTLDEIKAEDENEAINANSLPQVSETDNHLEHLPVHYMAQNTWAKWTHIAWHEELLGEQKKQQAQQQGPQPQGGQGGPQQPPKDKQSQEKAAAPLQGEMKTNALQGK